MTIPVGTLIEHFEFGPGKVREVFGSIATVNFFGEDIDCDINELEIKEVFSPEVSISVETSSKNKVAFRRGFEAVNLGVVPPDPSSLIEMSIGGDKVATEARASLENADSRGV